MINTHPTYEELTLFTSGSMQTHKAAAISAHVEYCEECKLNTKKLQSVAGASFSELSETSVSQEVKENLLSKLSDAPERTLESTTNTDNENSSGVPKVLKNLVPEGYNQLEWKWTGPGIHAAKLENFKNGTQLSLLKIQPGKAIASHTHESDEITVLLKGSLSDEFGVYKKGDYLVMNEEHEHRPVASADEECICLTVIDKPLRFTGSLMGLLNPVISRHLA
jgi:putative transcriptional regulator